MNRKKSVRIICIVLAILMALSLVASVIPTVFADELDELELLEQAKEEATSKRIQAQSKVQKLKDEQAAIIDEKIALEERNKAALEEITLIKKEIVLYDKKIEAKGKEVVAAQENEDEQLERYRTRIRAMEENGSYNILSLIFEAESFSSLMSAIDDYGDVMDSDKTLWNQLQDAREQLQEVKAEYEEYKADCEKKQKDLEKTQHELEEQIKEAEALIEEYTAKIAEAEEEEAAQERAEAAASAAASNFLAQYYANRQKAQEQQAAQQTSGDSSEGGEESVSSGAESYGTYTGEVTTGSGALCWPFPGHSSITSPYGYRSSTGSFHSGVDIDGFCSEGSPIVAADSGTVIKAEYYGGYGNCIIIDHGNGMSTLYAHLCDMYVGVGQSVSAGETIGGCGHTGTCYGADGNHLHFEVMIDGNTTDPQAYI